jgi:alcohol dehydrogenase class IV
MNDVTSLKGNWGFPNSIRFGCGRIAELPAALQELGIKKPLLVTDAGLAALDVTERVMDLCAAAGMPCDLFKDVKPNPTAENVEEGVVAAKEFGSDGVIAFGGGSALDAAKAVALMVGQNRPIWDFEDVGDNWTRVNAAGMIPVVAVPTTSGTGSEVGRASVITNAQNHTKKIIFHPDMLPGRVIADPELTAGLPPFVTAFTGMDALSHALEAYSAPGYHPMAEGIAIKAIMLVKDNLPQAVADGGNLVARSNMLAASSMGAVAFQRGLGAMHALAHTLGGLYDAPHGLLNAVLMPYVLVANRSVIEERIGDLALTLKLEPSFDAFLQWVLDIRTEVGIPNDLAGLDIKDDEAQKVGRLSEIDPSAGTNPILFTADAYAAIFRKAVSGDLN